MAVTFIQRNFNGVRGLVQFNCDNTLEEIRTTGYLIQPEILDQIELLNNGEFQWETTDIVLVNYVDGNGFFNRNPVTNAFVEKTDTGTITEFLPTITFATPGDLTVVYHNREGICFKNSNLAYLHFTVDFTATHSTSAGAFRIGSFPFTVTTVMSASINTTSPDPTRDIIYPPSRTFLNLVPFGGQTYCTVRAMGSTVTDFDLDHTHIVTGHPYTLSGSTIYIT